MCTPWTITRFVRWRIKDWASCFLVCRFPLDDEPDTCHLSPPKRPIRKMVFEMKDDSRGNNKKANKNKKLLKRQKCNKENIGPTTPARNNISMENGTDDSSWPHFAEEDYIVFCFKEDGAFDVVKDGKSETSNHLDRTSRSPRSVNRKLKYGEDAETINKISHEERSTEDGHDICPKTEGEITHVKEGEDEESIYLDMESPLGGMRRKYQIEETENRATVSVESSDSNQSDGSTGSFAFPVLRWERMGSPAQMPKSEDLYLRKHKARSMTFQYCCRF